MPARGFLPLTRMSERAKLASQDSDSAFFFDLMYEAELIIKFLTLELIAAIADENEGHRHMLEGRLIRADGIGEWAEVLDAALTGPASQHLVTEIRPSLIALTQKFKVGDPSWQRLAIDALASVSQTIDPDGQPPSKSPAALRDWVRQFARIRNRTRGHGAPKAGKLAGVCDSLDASLEQVRTNAPFVERPWAYLHQTLSGKYRVSSFGGKRDPFLHLARDSGQPYANGAYVFLDQPRKVRLLRTDSELTDFYVPNGGFRTGTFELISYISDETLQGDASAYALPIAAQPFSETRAAREFDVVGETFTNMPPPRDGYISRPHLEDELRRIIEDSRHPVITLHGRGGIGKTSLALQVLHEVAAQPLAFAIAWFSARDIDLTASGPKIVRPDVLNIDEMARDFTRLVGSGAKGSAQLELLTACLSGDNSDGPYIFVLDNFETVHDQAGLYTFLSNAVRLPNKVLITTRTRAFKADYPIEVHGMERSEYTELVSEQSIKLSIERLIDSDYVDTLYKDSNGHPYITKIALGEVARSGSRVSLKAIVGSQDRLLEALFERSYSSLSTAAQRVFLTLCGWRSLVPLVGLKAVMLRPGNEGLDVESAVAELERTSLVETHQDENSAALFLAIPLATQIFGKRKLITSDLKISVDTDLEMLQRFGSATTTDVAQGLGPRVERAAAEAAKRRAAGHDIADELRILESIASEYPPAWVNLARIHRESGDSDSAMSALRMYLERQPSDPSAWREFISLCRSTGDALAEIQARLQLAELEDSDIEALSNSAARLNGLLSRKELSLDGEERRRLIESFLTLLATHESAANATDLSRMAWLALHNGNVDRAKRWAQRGLDGEPNNEHCQRLMVRLEGQ